MGTQSWGTQTPLRKAIEEEPFRFGFFQMARLLAILQRERGYERRPHQEEDLKARFRTSTKLGFPPSEIEDVQQLEPESDTLDEAPLPRVTVPLLGLTGPSGVMPRHYSELVMQEARAGRRGLHDFLDLFSHRFLVLFARAFFKNRKAVQYELWGDDNGVGRYLFDLLGLGTPGLRHRLEVDDSVFRPYAGTLGSRPVSALGLATMIEETFDVPAEVHCFEGAWYDLDPREYAPLDRIQLGVNSVLGQRIWQREFRFRLRLGPMDHRTFSRFLPEAEDGLLEKVHSMARFAAGWEYDTVIQLVLDRRDVPAIRLGDERANAPRLGWSTWLVTGPMDDDPEDARFTSPDPDRPQENTPRPFAFV